jgi:phosphate transport system substrate-binding protein
MKQTFCLCILTSIIFTACKPSAISPTPIPITVQFTSASTPWLSTIYKCAGANVVAAEQRGADFQELQSVDIALRVGQPAQLIFPAYQISSEDIIVIVNPQNPVKSLSEAEVRGIFTGQVLNWDMAGGTIANIQVWTYSAGEDIQEILDEVIFNGSPVTSTARLAANPEQMVQAIADDVNAVGILTRSLKTDRVEEVNIVSAFPVLAISKAGEQRAVQEMLACMQK